MSSKKNIDISDSQTLYFENILEENIDKLEIISPNYSYRPIKRQTKKNMLAYDVLVESNTRPEPVNAVTKEKSDKAATAAMPAKPELKIRNSTNVNLDLKITATCGNGKYDITYNDDIRVLRDNEKSLNVPVEPVSSVKIEFVDGRYKSVTKSIKKVVPNYAVELTQTDLEERKSSTRQPILIAKILAVVAGVIVVAIAFSAIFSKCSKDDGLL